jgi:hypothetical protein
MMLGFMIAAACSRSLMEITPLIPILSRWGKHVIKMTPFDMLFLSLFLLEHKKEK